MDKNRKNRIVNWIMAVSLIVVMTTGMLLRALPDMWLGIAHSRNLREKRLRKVDASEAFNAFLRGGRRKDFIW